MRAHRAYLLGGILGLAILAAGAGLQALPVAASPHNSAKAVELNRALKGDRLPAVAPAGETESLPAARPRLPEGCEASVSSMTRSSLAHTPARCLS
jgi:hypothetical protein